MFKHEVCTNKLKNGEKKCNFDSILILNNAPFWRITYYDLVGKG